MSSLNFKMVKKMGKVPKVFRKVYLSDYLKNKAVKYSYLILDLPENLKGKKVKVNCFDNQVYVLNNTLINACSNFKGGKL